jgi:hypothetical protein
MNSFTYQNYTLLLSENGFYYTGECKELFFKRTLNDVSSLMDYFEKFVNAKLDLEVV